LALCGVRELQIAVRGQRRVRLGKRLRATGHGHRLLLLMLLMVARLVLYRVLSGLPLLVCPELAVLLVVPLQRLPLMMTMLMLAGLLSLPVLARQGQTQLLLVNLQRLMLLLSHLTPPSTSLGMLLVLLMLGLPPLRAVHHLWLLLQWALGHPPMLQLSLCLMWLLCSS